MITTYLRLAPTYWVGATIKIIVVEARCSDGIRISQGS